MNNEARTLRRRRRRMLRRLSKSCASAPRSVVADRVAAMLMASVGADIDSLVADWNARAQLAREAEAKP